MARRNVRTIAGNNSSLLLWRIQQLRAELVNKSVANCEREISIIAHDLIVGSRRVEDLPLEVLAGVNALVDERIRSLSDRLTEMAAAQEAPPAVADAAAAAAAPAASGGGETRQ